jgi:hypothetical protein
MFPAFRSSWSALGYCTLLLVLLLLPIVNFAIGHPPREQAYAGLTEEAGPIEMQVREIYHDPQDADVVLLGSSLIRAAVDVPTLEKALTAHLGRPAHVVVLAMNWQGVDMQYFLLRDYLTHHHATLVIWNLPEPGARHLEPHVEAFRWLRFGEYQDALEGLPVIYRFAIYGDMVLGAPRELLSHFRPNLENSQETPPEGAGSSIGYYGAPFVSEALDTGKAPPLAVTYENSPYPLVRQAGRPLNAYEQHFAQRIIELSESSGSSLAFLHIPMDTEYGLNFMPERSRFGGALGVNRALVGTTSVALFGTMDRTRFEHFYRDQHFNTNGRLRYTNAVMPAIMKAFEDARDHSQHDGK